MKNKKPEKTEEEGKMNREKKIDSNQRSHLSLASERRVPATVEKKINGPTQLLCKIRSSSGERSYGHMPSTHRAVRKRWIRAPDGSPKINVDASVGRHNDRGCCAAICRDGEGRYMGASATCFQGLVDPEILEAHACSEVLAQAADLYIQKVRIATDCKATVSHLKDSYLGTVSMIIRDIKEKQRSFQSAEIVHEGRDSNGDTHNLAKVAVSLDYGRHVWLNTTPNFFYVPNTLEV